MIIADVGFGRLNAALGPDVWMSTCGRIALVLVMTDPAHPWRIEIDGHRIRSKFSTPAVAVRRTLERMKQNERGKVAAIGIPRDTPGRPHRQA